MVRLLMFTAKLEGEGVQPSSSVIWYSLFLALGSGVKLKFEFVTSEIKKLG